CFLLIRRPPRSTLFPTRRSSDLASALDYPGILSPGNVYRLTSAQPPADGLLAPASPLAIKRFCRGTGILTCFPSVTPFGLTLGRSEEHTSELQSRFDLVCRLLLE